MTLKKLLRFVDLQDKKLIRQYSQRLSTKERLLARTVKLAEEFGELSNEILASVGDQREEKLAKYYKGGLEGEFADVIITTLLVAKTAKIDIQKALEKRIQEITKRNKQS